MLIIETMWTKSIELHCCCVYSSFNWCSIFTSLLILSTDIQQIIPQIFLISVFSIHAIFISKKDIRSYLVRNNFCWMIFSPSHSFLTTTPSMDCSNLSFLWSQWRYSNELLVSIVHHRFHLYYCLQLSNFSFRISEIIDRNNCQNYSLLMRLSFKQIDWNFSSTTTSLTYETFFITKHSSCDL